MRLGLRQIIWSLGSLRFSVFLLGASVLLIFFGTLDQVQIGIREAQKIYFESLFAVWRYPEIWPWGAYLKWIPVPLPGGYLLGGLLAVNLVAGHIRYWRPRWTVIGITFIHIGIILLLVGQLISNLYQEDHYMWLNEGERADFVRSFRMDELYIAQQSGDVLKVYSFPFDRLREGEMVETDSFPFALRVAKLYRNTEIVPGGTVQGRSTEGVTHGIGVQFNLGVKEIGSFHSDNQRDIRSAVVDVIAEGESVGRFLLSNAFEDRFPEQVVTLAGESYAIGVRYKRTYLPFSLTLLDFRHDRYPGTNVPRNFSSRVRLDFPGAESSKEVMIFMNNPLRHDGLTFYQASFAKQDTASMFHVVRNPGRLIPYIACILVSIGLLYQFTVAAYRLTGRKRT